MTANDVLNALMAWGEDKICATEVRFSDHGTRADFFTIEPMASVNFRTTAYEIKVTRQDFNRDTRQKQAAALQYSDRFFYVTPPNLIDKSELPEWAGLIEWNGKSFAVKRKPPRRMKQEASWRIVVDLLRSSTRVRRDTNLFTSQIAALQHTLRAKNAQQEVAEDWRRQKWIKQNIPQFTKDKP
jgi:hypothetical protein